MATKRKTRTREAALELEDEADTGAVSADERAIFDAIEADEESVNWRVLVYRAAPRTGEPDEWLFDIEPRELEGIQERLRDELHGGRFRVVIRRGPLIYKRLSYAIASKPALVAPPAPGADHAAQLLAGLTAQMERQNQTLITLAERLSTRPEPPAVDAVEQFSRMAAAVKDLIPAAATATSEGAALAPSEYMKVFREGIEFARELGSSDRETGLFDLAQAAIPPMLELLRAGQAKPAPPAITLQRRPIEPTPRATSSTSSTEAPPPSTSAAPAPTSSTSSNGAAPPSILADARALAFVQAQLRYLVDRAKKGSDPTLYAEWTEDNLPGEILDSLLSTPDPLAALEAIAPPVTPYRQWFEKLIEALTAGPEGTADETAAARDARDSNSEPEDSGGNPTG